MPLSKVCRSQRHPPSQSAHPAGRACSAPWSSLPCAWPAIDRTTRTARRAHRRSAAQSWTPEHTVGYSKVWLLHNSGNFGPQKLEKEVADESISTARWISMKSRHSGFKTFRRVQMVLAGAGRAKFGLQMNGARSKPHYSGILQIPMERQAQIKTHANYVCRTATKYHTLLPLTSTGFYPDGNFPGKSMENSGKQNPKMGFKPPEHSRKRAMFSRFRALFSGDNSRKCRSRLSCGKSRGFLCHAVKIAPLPKTDFLENAAACEPLCALLYFCDLANQSKFDAKAVK
jgi:hypothetical protein